MYRKGLDMRWNVFLISFFTSLIFIPMIIIILYITMFSKSIRHSQENVSSMPEKYEVPTISMNKLSKQLSETNTDFTVYFTYLSQTDSIEVNAGDAELNAFYLVQNTKQGRIHISGVNGWSKDDSKSFISTILLEKDVNYKDLCKTIVKSIDSYVTDSNIQKGGSV